MKRIGLFGGTFNPPHKMHLEIAKDALKEYDLDCVWMIPNGIPPHKSIGKDDALTLHRKEMLSILIANEDRILLKEFEIYKLFKNYTYLTMEFLNKEYKDCEFYYIIGEDSLTDFSTWGNYKELAKMCKFLVCIRTSETFDEFNKRCEFFSKKYKTEFLPLKLKKMYISSTELREYIKNEDKNMYKYLTKGVSEYIRDHDLYDETSDFGMEIKDIIEDLKIRLKPYRFHHSIGVMNTAANLAMRYGYPIKKAMYGGLLHDCAKNIEDEGLIKICEDNGIEITETEYRLPYLLHGKAGAVLAKQLYKVTDEEILHAISYHTTGQPDMNLLDKIVFISDYIEPSRDKAKNLREIRQRAYMDIDDALVFILKDTIEYLKETNVDMDKKTIETFEYYKNRTHYLSW